MTTVFSVGHGNRSLDEFLRLLAGAHVECLVDVRAYPASRRHPHFAQAPLSRALAATAVDYRWEGKAMGGRRRADNRSPHSALRNESFRAYADHMMREEFREALERLLTLASGQRAAIMCAETLPWRCHRYLIADSLVARGVEVVHLISEKETRAHALSALARREGEVLIYDVGAASCKSTS